GEESLNPSFGLANEVHEGHGRAFLRETIELNGSEYRACLIHRGLEEAPIDRSKQRGVDDRGERGG
ncbi:MAG TPA: hypothetical protein QGF05_14055, partial [Dehalococcoidia bacterium]|nr:hypothetical protein [Dehalococcoidia bacterium]